MEIKVDEISKIIRQRIEGYDKQTDLAEVGSVISVGDGIGRIYGLDKVMYGVELQYGSRENFSDGWTYDDFRIQFSFRYKYSFWLGGN